MALIDNSSKGLTVITGKEEKTSKKWNTAYTPDCHKGFTEIYPNLYVGRKSDVSDILDRIDVLIPLDSLNGSIWKNGYRKLIVYVPTPDYGVLPVDVEAHFVKVVLKLLSQGKRVAIFCIGGHGRTGYFASLVLGKLGIDDPIAHIREKHCKKAVEDQSQVEHIADFLNRPEWKEQYKIFPKLYGYGYGDYGTSKIGRKELPKECCGKCDMWALNDGGIHMGYCFYLQKQAWDDDKPCIEFNPLNAIIKTSHEEVK